MLLTDLIHSHIPKFAEFFLDLVTTKHILVSLRDLILDRLVRLIWDLSHQFGINLFQRRQTLKWLWL